MSRISVEKFVECIELSGLIAKDELARTLDSWKAADHAASGDSARLARTLIEAKLLTRWQADNLLYGRSSGFFLSQFKLLGVLGAGRSWSVYLASHTSMPVLRAIVVLPVSRVNNSSWLARFKNLATATVSVNHPNIAPTYDISQQKKHHYIVMEYIEGRDLQAIATEQGPLEPRIAADFVRQAAQGLAHAHARGLVHRDIKPNHLMVDKQGTVKLLDWSMSRSIGETAAPLTAAANECTWTNFDFVAPEQTLDADLVDPRPDIYGLGCTLYFMLARHPLFAARPQVQRILVHQSSQRPSVSAERPDVPQPLAELCSRMMARSPDERPQEILQ